MTSSGPAAGGWAVRHLVGDAASLHRRELPGVVEREVWVLEAVRPALVLGSTQSDDLVDAAAVRALDVDVVRRRSGGGAVLVVPETTVWIDVVMPASDPLWQDDVARAAYWLGEAWQAALARVGVGSTEVHRGGLACGPLGRLVCFAAVGAGEVLVGGRKVVGISQRRTRAGARFQCAAYTRWEPEPLARLLRLDGDGAAVLADAAAGTGGEPGALVDAFLRHIPA